MILSHEPTMRMIAASIDGGNALDPSGFPLEALHQAVFYVLYTMCALATFLAIERFIYLWSARRNAVRIEKALKPGAGSLQGIPQVLLKSDLPAAAALAEVQLRFAHLRDRGDLEDTTDTAYIHAKRRLHQHIWVLDTVITAAPLLGLLGTILGIIDTFHALAASGISDPSAVSRGIGVALVATAIGIGTALYALLLHNIFQAKIAGMLDIIRIILMRISIVQQH